MKDAEFKMEYDKPRSEKNANDNDNDNDSVNVNDLLAIANIKKLNKKSEEISLNNLSNNYWRVPAFFESTNNKVVTEAATSSSLPDQIIERFFFPFCGQISEFFFSVSH